MLLELKFVPCGSHDKHCPVLRQDDTPKPTNPDVYIHGTASATFFVSQYAGFGQDDITVSLKVPLRLAYVALRCCAENLMPCAYSKRTWHFE